MRPWQWSQCVVSTWTDQQTSGTIERGRKGSAHMWKPDEHEREMMGRKKGMAQ